MNLANPEAWQDQIERVFSELSGIQTCWKNRRQRNTRKARCTLMVTSIRPVGTVERTFRFEPGPIPKAECIPTDFIQQRVTLQVQVSAESQDARMWAQTTLQKIAVGLEVDSTREALALCGTSFARYTAITILDRRAEGRQKSFGNMDVLLNVCAELQGKPVNRIAQILLEGTVATPAGDIAVPPETIDLP